jgi:hypothetical protein
MFDICPSLFIRMCIIVTVIGVERRRIYDIVNILEAVDIVSRKGKNEYVWHGLTRLAKALTILHVIISLFVMLIFCLMVMLCYVMITA